LGYASAIDSEGRTIWIVGAHRDDGKRYVVRADEVLSAPAIHSVFELHVFLHVEENERAEFFPLASTGGVAAELVRIVHPRFVLLANLLAFLVFPVLPAGEVAYIKRLKNWLQR